MKPSHIQLLTRILGSVAGLCAVAVAIRGIRPFIGFSDAGFWSRVGGALLLLLACVLLRGAYLAWFRWSPLAIRHALAVVFIIPSSYVSIAASGLGGRFWGLALFTITVASCYALYRCTSRILTRRAFTPSHA
jgi:hypothetical protein